LIAQATRIRATHRQRASRIARHSQLTQMAVAKASPRLRRRSDPVGLHAEMLSHKPDKVTHSLLSGPKEALNPLIPLRLFFGFLTGN
jgi:hypothetical protein